MSKSDFIAYQELLELSDKDALQKAMNYPLPRYLYERRIALHEEGNSQEANGVFVGGIGFIPADQRDVIAILAEEYTRMESVQTAVIFAITGKKHLEVSVRTHLVSLDVNQMCRDLFGEFGGGKSNAGAAKIPLNFYEELDDKSSIPFWNVTKKHMFKKVLKENWSYNEEVE
jgi:nanoRNase/pAp phosphatase (c-di-AMP/oligoRNAs hydrolase)